MSTPHVLRDKPCTVLLPLLLAAFILLPASAIAQKARVVIASTTAEDALSRSNDGGKIIRLHTRPVASREKPTLPIWDKDGECNVIRFSQVAPVKSALQRGGKTAKSQSKLLPSANNWNAVDYNHQMLENALAAAVLIVLVISGQWIFSTLLATIP